MRIIIVIIVRVIAIIVIVVTRSDQPAIEFGLEVTIHPSIDLDSEVDPSLSLKQIRLHIRHPVKSSSIWEDIAITWKLWACPLMERDDDGEVDENELGHAPWI